MLKVCTKLIFQSDLGLLLSVLIIKTIEMPNNSHLLLKTDEPLKLKTSISTNTLLNMFLNIILLHLLF